MPVARDPLIVSSESPLLFATHDQCTCPPHTPLRLPSSRAPHFLFFFFFFFVAFFSCPFILSFPLWWIFLFPSPQDPPRRVASESPKLSTFRSSIYLFLLLIFRFSSQQPTVRTSKSTHDPCIFIRHSPQRSRLFHLIPPSLHTSAHISLSSFLHFFFCLMHISQTCAIRSTYLCSVCF